MARAINATAPGVLAREAAAAGTWLVHYGTDYVFDGSGSGPWAEEDPTGPLNVYGQTKLEGEELIRGSGCRHLILRTSWVYASRGQNFARTMLRLAAERDSLTIIDDQHGAPTGAELLADVTAHAMLSVIRRPKLAGTYHVAASGETTRHGYATHVIEAARAAGLPIRVAPGGGSAEYRPRRLRPKRSGQGTHDWPPASFDKPSTSSFPIGRRVWSECWPKYSVAETYEPRPIRRGIQS